MFIPIFFFLLMIDKLVFSLLYRQECALWGNTTHVLSCHICLIAEQLWCSVYPWWPQLCCLRFQVLHRLCIHIKILRLQSYRFTDKFRIPEYSLSMCLTFHDVILYNFMTTCLHCDSFYQMHFRVVHGESSPCIWVTDLCVKGSTTML